MLDSYVRPLIDPPLNTSGRFLARRGIKANHVTLFGFGLGLFMIPALAFQAYTAALILLLLNRLCDGLDGGVARARGLSDFGGFLDILSDFIIYAGVVFGFALGNPAHLLPAAFLIFSFIGPITSFLAFAIIAAKRKVTTEAQGKKSFFYLSGLCEGTETFAALGLMCLFPNFFPEIAWSYGVLCWITTWGRVKEARRTFQKPYQ